MNISWVLVMPTPFGEEAVGYQVLVELLGSPQDCLVAMEALGHYWRNLLPTWLAKVSQ